MRLEVGRVEHDGLRLGTTAASPSIIWRKMPFSPHRSDRLYSVLWGPFLGPIAPAQTVAIDEDHAAKHPPVINRGLPSLLGKDG